MVIFHCGCNYVKISTGYWYIRMYMRTSVLQNFIFFLLLMDSAFLPAGARAARERLVLRLLYVFCVFLFVCASALITCVIYYVIRYYATAVYSSFLRFAGQATANEGSFVLPRWQKRGR